MPKRPHFFNFITKGMRSHNPSFQLSLLQLFNKNNNNGHHNYNTGREANEAHEFEPRSGARTIFEVLFRHLKLSRARI